MKKYLPLILLGFGILVVVGAFVIVRGRREVNDAGEEEGALIDVALNERPIVSLVPRSDGHYLDMKIEKLMVPGAKKLDYDFFYKTEGSNQPLGGTGVIPLEGKDVVEEELLFGTVSSGNYRYDEGVEEGTITLRFRNSDGELLVKFETDFHLQTGTDLLSSIDENFKYKSKEESEEFFLTMTTIGYPADAPAEVESGPYGVFSSGDEEFPGTVDLGVDNVYYWDGSEWNMLEGNESKNMGIFFGSTQ